MTLVASRGVLRGPGVRRDSNGCVTGPRDGRPNLVGLTAILIGWPGFESGRVYWSRGCFGDTGGCTDGVAELRRGTYTLPLSSERASGPRVLLAQERGAGVNWVLQDTPAPAATQWCGTTATCSIESLQPTYTPTG